MDAWLARRLIVTDALGSWLFEHFRQRCRDAGVYTAARQLRKQGYPLNLVLAMAQAL